MRTIRFDGHPNEPSINPGDMLKIISACDTEHIVQVRKEVSSKDGCIGCVFHDNRKCHVPFGQEGSTLCYDARSVFVPIEVVMEEL